MAWDLEFRLSGGAANADPLAALGGAIAAASLSGDTVTRAASPIAGVSVAAAYGNAAGAGSLKFYYGASSMSFGWIPPGEAAAAESPVAVAVAGGAARIEVGAGNFRGALLLDVDPAQCPGVDKTETITVAPAVGNLFDDVSEERARSGGNDYRCVYLLNTSATLNYALILFIVGQPTNGIALALCFDPSGVGGTPTAIPSPSSDPGLSFVAPASVLDADALNIALAPGEAIALWLRRSVPPMTMLQADLVLGRVALLAEAT